MKLKPAGEKVRLCDLEPGTLFAYGDDCIAVKSEYLLNSGKIEAIIVGSGEFFHGGAKTVQEHFNLMVQPLEIEEEVRCGECRKYVDGHCCRSLGGGSYVPFPMKPDDFCSYGERRTDNA